MKNKFVADGPSRLLAARKKASEKSIEKKYAEELLQAGTVQKLKTRARMALEHLRRGQDIADRQPSPGTLW